MQLNLSQVAKLFSVSENTVALWVRQENLPAHMVNSQYRFDRAELLEWAATTQHRFSPTIFEDINGDEFTEVVLADALERGGVSLRVAGSDRYEVFREVVCSLPLPDSFDRDGLLDLLMAREKSGGTAIGNGIAIPHPRYPVVVPGNLSIIRTCYLEQALDYHAADGKPVDILFVMICPTVHEHLQLLARLACVLKSPEFRKLLESRPDQTRLVSAVRAAEVTFGKKAECQQA
jgi:PTS system nitrogen regulatory IIA component